MAIILHFFKRDDSLFDSQNLIRKTLFLFGWMKLAPISPFDLKFLVGLWFDSVGTCLC